MLVCDQSVDFIKISGDSNFEVPLFEFPRDLRFFQFQTFMFQKRKFHSA